MKTHSLHFPFARLLCVALALSGLVRTPASAQQMPQDRWRFDGLQFSSPTPTNYLGSIAIGTGGVYVAENNSNILQFTEGGVFIRRFTTTFSSVNGIACDPVGNVYVLDGGASAVKKFDQNGTVISQWGSSGTSDGQFGSGFYWATMIAVDNNSQIYVCDPGNQRVQVFDSNGNFVRKWGQPGNLPSQFSPGSPIEIATSPTGDIFVSKGNDGNHVDVEVFTATGLYQRSIAALNNGYANHSFNITPDGLLVNLAYTSVVVYDSNFLAIGGAGLLVIFDTSERAVAISKRGDIFSIQGRNVVVYEREYSNVQNSLLPPAIPQPIVLAAAQRTGTSWLDIDYQVTDADSPTVTTATLAFHNGGTTLNEAVVMSTFQEGSGANVGANQPTGVPRHLTWNMAADWSVDFAQVQVEALAKDSRNLLGIHWIAVPASGGNPAIQVSAGPVSDAVLLDVWFWLVATHQAGIALGSGTIAGTANPYNGVALASGSATTAAGRQYLYGLMGVRSITAAEIAQAQGGSYGFSSVDANSVVKLP